MIADLEDLVSSHTKWHSQLRMHRPTDHTTLMVGKWNPREPCPEM